MAPVATQESAIVSASKKPIQSFRLRGVSVAVFSNSGKVAGRDVTFYKAAIERSYKDDNGNWQSTTSFGRDDLPVLALLAKQAWQFILETEATRGKEADPE